MDNIEELSIFLPAYNEEKNIGKTLADVSKIAEKVAGNYEILVINDGSKDKTGEIVSDFASRNKKVRIISHDTNKGYGAALTSGFYNSKYEWIAFMDSDGQFDFSEISKFIEKQKKTGADLVIGYYINRRVSFLRKINTSAWEFVVNLMFGLKVRDIDCAFKLINKRVIEKIPRLESQRGAFISTEFLVKSKIKEFKIAEIPVHHYPRKEGASTGANLDVIINSFKDLFKLRRKLKNEPLN